MSDEFLKEWPVDEKLPAQILVLCSSILFLINGILLFIIYIYLSFRRSNCNRRS